MPKSFPDRLDLRQRMFMWSKTQRRLVAVLGGLVVFLFLAVVLILLFVTPTCRPEEGGSVLERIWRGIERKPWDGFFNALVIVLALAQLYYFRRAQQFERLVLTGTGIEYCSPLPAALKFLYPDWKVMWSQVRAVSLEGQKFAPGPQLTALVLDTGTRKKRIFPWRWVDPDAFAPVTPWKELRRMQRLSAAEAIAEIETGPLLRYVSAALPHLKIVRRGVFDGVFALEKNFSSLVIVIGFFVLVFYALGDGAFMGQETYVEDIPWNGFVLAGMAGGAGAALWMWRSGVPKAEGAIVALLFAAALGAAAYPGALRLNAMTDTEGLRSHEYVMRPNLTFAPVEPGLPELSFPQFADYWQQFKTGSKHEFELRRGGLGFYQLNFEPVRQRLRAFYESRNR